MISGHPIDREPLICAIIQRLQDLELEHKKPILQRYRSDCVTLGQEVDVIRGDSRRKGFALDVDSQGALVVRFEDGHTEAVDSGEVSIRGQLGYV